MPTSCCPYRVRFLLGGRHGDFKFLPPAGYAPCYEALLPKETMRVEPVKEYKRDLEGVRDLLGTTEFLSQASFIPVPVDTSQVRCYDLNVSTFLSVIHPTSSSAMDLINPKNFAL